MTDREEHLMRCKFRALEYVTKGDLQNAVASMISDMNKRDDTKVNPFLVVLGMRYIIDGDSPSVVRWIKGFR